eukprot:360339-Chlamydomonas_euryale.AAC.9
MAETSPPCATDAEPVRADPEGRPQLMSAAGKEQRELAFLPVTIEDAPRARSHAPPAQCKLAAASEPPDCILVTLGAAAACPRCNGFGGSATLPHDWTIDVPVTQLHTVSAHLMGDLLSGSSSSSSSRA